MEWVRKGKNQEDIAPGENNTAPERKFGEE
jgi:hypothetical protein